MLFNINVKLISPAYRLIIMLIAFGFSFTLSSQTVLSAGDILVIGFKTNATTDAGNDAFKLVTLVDLQCNTKFIVTDNNWNNSLPDWACSNDEFAIEITSSTIISAGSVFYIDASASGAAATCSGGTITRTDLGNPWGTDYGLSSGGDNIYVLQGTRAAPTFISAIKNGAFANSACSDKDRASIPTGLTAGTNAVAMASSQNQWHYNCNTNNGTKAVLRSAICNSANWINTAGQSWNNSTGIFTVTDGQIQYGVLAVSGAGCGCLAGCNLAYSGTSNCTGVTGDCTAGYQNMSRNIIVPAGCTYSVSATMRPRPHGCSTPGADGNCQTCDVVKVDILAGVKIFQQGASNSSLNDSYSATGPATIVVSGKANRADEIITYGIQATTCTCLLTLLPVELSAFNAVKIDQSVELSWSTMSERNNSFFTIERSLDAVSWEIINIVAGQNESSSIYNYTIYDSSPLSGISYYRLKQTDINEAYSYSQIVTIDNSNKEQKIIRMIDIYGRELDENATGLIILIYQNGEVKKVYK
jgi:hypothetical protein